MRKLELSYLSYRDLEADDLIFLRVQKSPDERYYRILMKKSQEEIVTKLKELKKTIGRKDFQKPMPVREYKWRLCSK